MLAELGPKATTTNHIAERAGISIGSLYRYFPDKGSVISAVIDSETQREAESLGNSEWSVERLDLPEALAELVDFQLERQRRLVEQGGETYRAHQDASKLTRRMGADEVETRIRQVLASHQSRTRVGDLDQATFLLVRGISAIVRLTTEERPEKLWEPSFRQELIEMTQRYVMSGEIRER